MILVYTGKPFLGKRIIEAIGTEIKQNYPNQRIIVISQLHVANLKFQYPKNLTWSDYPYIDEPSYKFNTNNNWETWRPFEANENNTLTTLTKEEVQEAKTIIYADDPFNTNCHNFSLFIEHFFVDKKIETPAMHLMSLANEDILRQWSNRKDFYELFGEYIKESEIKRYFNYNFNINSFGIFGRVLKDIGVEKDKNYISKYALQLLYELKDINEQSIQSQGYIRNKSEGEIVKLMSNWKGTGKYIKLDRRHGRLGSEMSSTSIVESLLDLGLAVRDLKKKVIRISPLGEMFLSQLHKDCLDKDLPFRYELWQYEDLEMAKSKIDEYIKTFFGKQKRKMKSN